MEFTDDIQAVKTFISGTNAEGGGDEPEDLQGGLKLALLQDWTEEASKRVYVIADAPCHGKKYHTCYSDDYPNGSPDGLVLEDLMKEFCRKDIEFQFMKLQNNCEKMIEVMKQCHQEVEVTDMTNISRSQPDFSSYSHKLLLEDCESESRLDCLMERAEKLEPISYESSSVSMASASYTKKA